MLYLLRTGPNWYEDVGKLQEENGTMVFKGMLGDVYLTEEDVRELIPQNNKYLDKLYTEYERGNTNVLVQYLSINYPKHGITSIINHLGEHYKVWLPSYDRSSQQITYTVQRTYKLPVISYEDVVKRVGLYKGSYNITVKVSDTLIMVEWEQTIPVTASIKSELAGLYESIRNVHNELEDVKEQYG